MSLHLLPRNGVSTLCHVEPGKIIELLEVPATVYMPYAIPEEEDWLVFVTNQHKVKTIERISPHAQVNLPICMIPLKPGPPTMEGVEEFRLKVIMPGFRPYVFLLDKRRLYVGGPCLGFIDLDDPIHTFHWLPLPKSFKANKGIDALVIDQGKLLAFDNFIEPIWLWEYDITGTTPTLIREVLLMIKLNPHIINAKKCDDKILVLWDSNHMGGGGSFLTCYSIEMEELGSMYISKSIRLETPKAVKGPGRYSKQEEPLPPNRKIPGHEWVELAIQNHRIYLAALDQGIACIELQSFLQLSHHHLPTYFKIPEFLVIYNVIALPDSDSIIVMGESNQPNGVAHSEVFNWSEIQNFESMPQNPKATTFGGKQSMESVLASMHLI